MCLNNICGILNVRWEDHSQVYITKDGQGRKLFTGAKCEVCGERMDGGFLIPP